MYLIEEFDEYSRSTTISDFPAMRYLVRNTDRFQFQGGHPGKGKDSRKENSRVLGQTISRYFIRYFLDTEYTANITDVLGKNLGANFGNVTVKRRTKGDTPDFISAGSSSNIFLTEAKGTRKFLSFSSQKFKEWRKQFSRVKILQDKTALSLKGYIIALCIANENNKRELSNSKILAEDPRTYGEQEFQESKQLYDLVRNAHYKNILAKIGMSYIGESLLYPGKLPVESKFSFPVFRSKVFNVEFVGVFNRPNLGIRFPFYHDVRLVREVKESSTFFLGIEKSVLLKLITLARASNENAVDDTPITLGVERAFNNSAILFRDGSMFCHPQLVSFTGYQDF